MCVYPIVINFQDLSYKVCVCLFVHLSVYVCLFVCLSVCPYACMSVCMYYVCLSVCLHARLYVCLFVCLSVCMSVCMYYVYLSICMYAHLSVCLSVCLYLSDGLAAGAGVIVRYLRYDVTDGCRGAGHSGGGQVSSVGGTHVPTVRGEEEG